MIDLSYFQSRIFLTAVIGASAAAASLFIYFKNSRKEISVPATRIETESTVESILKVTVLKLRYVYNSSRRDISNIEASTKTQIKIPDRTMSLLEDKLNYMKLCSISIIGFEKNVLEAQTLILKVFQNIEIYESSLSLLYSKLLLNDRNGNGLKIIKKSIGALILIEKPFVNKLLANHFINPLDKKEMNLYIIGLSNEINQAKIEIDRIIENNIKRAATFPVKLSTANEIESKEILSDSCNDQQIDKNIVKNSANLLPSCNRNDDIVSLWNILKNPYEVVEIIDYQHDGYTSVWIPHAISMDLFWVQIFHNDQYLSSLEKINEYLSEHFQQISKSEECSEILVGNLCCCPFQQSNIWLRSLILSTVSKTQSKILFVDYGDICVVNNEDCKTLPDLYRKLPWQAVPCSLRDTKQFYSDDKCKESHMNIFLENISLGIHVPSKVQVLSILDNGSYVVNLIVNIDNKEINILEYVSSLQRVKNSSPQTLPVSDSPKENKPEKKILTLNTNSDNLKKSQISISVQECNETLRTRQNNSNKFTLDNNKKYFRQRKNRNNRRGKLQI